MKKLFLYLILLIPLLSLGQVAELKHDASYFDYNWYGIHNFYGDSVYIYDLDVDTLTVDTAYVIDLKALVFQLDSLMIPDDSSGANLGTIALPFDTAYFDNVKLNNMLLPDDSSGANLGSFYSPFMNIYSNEYRVNSIIYPDVPGGAMVGNSHFIFASMWATHLYGDTTAGGDSIGFEFDDKNINFVNIDTLFDIGAIEADIGLFNVKIVPVSTDSVTIGSDVNIFAEIYADSMFANWFGGIGADFTLGDAGYDITVNADSIKHVSYIQITEARITDTLSVLRIAYIDTLDADTAHIDDLDADVLTADSMDVNELTLDTLVVSTIFTNNGETFLGNAATDTTEIYGITRFRQAVYFDSTGANRDVDLSLSDDGSSSKYWIYMSASRYIKRNGTMAMGTISSSGYIYSAVYRNTDDFAYFVGNGTDGSYSTAGALTWETADGNANALIFTAPEGGGTDVPVFVFGDSTIVNNDLGWFNGITEPRIAVVDDDADSYISFGFSADDVPEINKGGSAKALLLPDILTLQLHTIAAGDSVFLNTIVDAADTTLKVYNGSTWVTVQDLIP